MRFLEFGPDDTLMRSLARLRILPEYHVLDFFIKELSEEDPYLKNIPDALPGLEFRELKPAEAGALPFEKGLPDGEERRKRFNQGSRLFVVLKAGHAVAVDWMNPNFADLAHIKKPKLPVPLGMVYSHGAAVSSAYRNRGIGKWMKSRILRRFRDDGFSLVFLAVFLEDIRPSRWHLSYGCKKWGRVFHFTSRGKDFWWFRLTKTGRCYPPLLKNLRNA